MRGHELTTRAELLSDEPDHPRAGEEYFKIQLGPLIRLPQPIMAGRWKRFTFLYTTGEYLLTADTLTDLTVRSQERKTLWTALRERANQSQEYASDDLPEIDVDPSVLASLLGIQALNEGYDTDPEEI